MLIMCTGIILKDGRHLQSIRQVEQHFKVDLTRLYDDPKNCQIDSCTCQMDLEAFMNEPEQKGKFDHETGEYWER
jgi:hypothetical protein